MISIYMFIIVIEADYKMSYNSNMLREISLTFLLRDSELFR